MNICARLRAGMRGSDRPANKVGVNGPLLWLTTRLRAFGRGGPLRRPLPAVSVVVPLGPDAAATWPAARPAWPANLD